MPRNHKPSQVSQVLNRVNGSKRSSAPSTSHRCPSPKSPTGSHWWLIDSPRGETSDGVCRYCDATRVFPDGLTAAFTAGVSGQ